MADTANTERQFTLDDLDAFLTDLQLEDCVIDQPEQVRLTPAKPDNQKDKPRD